MEAANNNIVIAPFVMKTYQMVNDPSSDGFIAWGKANNCFIVIDPLDFSQRILPAYFKHDNFSSFVRQLNTYGFRKVDPDKWAFANEWFLRGQTHLLKNIVRRKHSSRKSTCKMEEEEDDDDDEEEEILMELAKLKQEQKELDQELSKMNKRLEATEKRPQQMMAFLCKVAQDPEILPRMILEKERNKKLTLASGDKKRRLMICSPLSVKSEEEDDDANFNNLDNFGQSSPETPSSAPWFSQRQVMGSSSLSSSSSAGIGGSTVAPPLESFPVHENIFSWDLGYLGGVVVGEAGSSPPPYPFSLLGGGF